MTTTAQLSVGRCLQLAELQSTSNGMATTTANPDGLEVLHMSDEHSKPEPSPAVGDSAPDPDPAEPTPATEESPTDDDDSLEARKEHIRRIREAIKQDLDNLFPSSDPDVPVH
jgi:hypothetical protein